MFLSCQLSPYSTETPYDLNHNTACNYINIVTSFMEMCIALTKLFLYISVITQCSISKSSHLETLFKICEFVETMDCFCAGAYSFTSGGHLTQVIVLVHR